MSFLSETNSLSVRRQILREATARFGARRMQARFTSGGWLLTDRKTGDEYAVVDTTHAPGIRFEQIGWGGDV